MILDGHIHMYRPREGGRGFLQRLRAAGVDGGIVISSPPSSFPYLGEPAPFQQRLEGVMACAEAGPRLYPFYWIDPTEGDAARQVAAAVQRGVRGFKVICNHFFPGDSRAMLAYRAIAEAGRPLLFHSGILYDGMVSSKYNRPVEFEAMLEVPGLRFALAHVSWPWCDELIAVFGKFQAARHGRPDLSVELFVDTTPGTPAFYRLDALTKLFTVGFDVKRNVLFGTDSRVASYSSATVKGQIDRDNAIYDQLALDEEVRRGIFGENLLRFVAPPSGPK